MGTAPANLCKRNQSEGWDARARVGRCTKQRAGRTLGTTIRPSSVVVRLGFQPARLNGIKQSFTIEYILATHVDRAIVISQRDTAALAQEQQRDEEDEQHEEQRGEHDEQREQDVQRIAVRRRLAAGDGCAGRRITPHARRVPLVGYLLLLLLLVGVGDDGVEPCDDDAPGILRLSH